MNRLYSSFRILTVSNGKRLTSYDGESDSPRRARTWSRFTAQDSY